MSCVYNDIYQNPIPKHKLVDLPTHPGVYVYRDRVGDILYIGKAKNLRKRIKSYFGSKQLDNKTKRLVSHICDLEFIVCETELEALILESNMIKECRPPYNILVRNDSHYPYIKLSWADNYPRATVTTKVEDDGSLYYGPFFPISIANRTLELIQRFFRLRHCDTHFKKPMNDRACLKYQLNRCTAPCIAAITQEEYRRQANGARLFLEGLRSELKDMLKVAMWNAAKNEAFELAATYRDDLYHLDTWFSRQRAATLDQRSVDVYGSAVLGCCVCVHRLVIRNGLILGRMEYLIHDIDFFDSVATAEILKRVYTEEKAPCEILVEHEPADCILLREWLGVTSGTKPIIHVPIRGYKAGILAMAQKNAKLALERKFEKASFNQMILKELCNILSLAKVPRWIECFDVSHHSGREVVASCVVFMDGLPDRSRYRRFKISNEQNNDFANIAEAVTRRYRRLKRENLGFPDLVIIDGGLGQLHVVELALMALDLNIFELASIAKKEELVFRPGSNEPLRIPRDSNELHILQRIRDEAHRFAVGYHRILKSKEILQSELTQIPGIGLVKARNLLKYYGSVRAIREASYIDLEKKFGSSIAKNIAAWLKG
jgi:excinuclease ABC subunit C